METAVILLGVILALAVFAAIYFGFLVWLYRKIPELISTVESTRGTGRQKMELVDYELSYRVPVPFRWFVTEKWLEKQAQTAYDSMKNFAEWRRKNEQKKGRKTTANTIDFAVVEPLMDDLIWMSIPALKERAASLGVDVEQYTDTRELIHAILERVAKEA